MNNGNSDNSQNPTLRPNNPFANLPNNNSANNGHSVAGRDSQLEELRKRVDDSAYANSAYDRANAFSVTNTREQPNIGIGGSATAYGGIKDADLEFLSITANEPEPQPEPEPAPVIPEPVMPQPEPQPEPEPAPRPMPEIPQEAPREEQFVQAVQQQPTPPPAPQPAPAPAKEKSGLSLPLIIVIVIVALALIGLAIWAILALRNRNGGVDPTPAPTPAPVEPEEEKVGYEEYNRRIEAKEAVDCTATYSRSSYTGKDYTAGEYEIYSEKSWTIAADEGWNHVFVSNYDFRYNLAEGSAIANRGLKNSPASIYFDGDDAYLWSVTLTPRAGGDGTAKYRLASYESVAPSIKMTRAEVESSAIENFYKTIKVSSEEINDSETGDIQFVCKKDGGLSNYQEFIDARKAEIGSGDAE